MKRTAVIKNGRCIGGYNGGHGVKSFEEKRIKKVDRFGVFKATTPKERDIAITRTWIISKVKEMRAFGCSPSVLTDWLFNNENIEIYPGKKDEIENIIKEYFRYS